MSNGVKYNWKKLRGEYVRGDIETVREFLKEKKIPYTGNTAQKVVGWPSEREAYQRDLQDKISDKTIESVSETEAQVRSRQAKFARMLQLKAVRALQDQVPENAMESLRMLDTGLSQERQALDLNKPSIVAGNLNVAILNTRYGKALQQMTYEELRKVLDRLAELDAQGAQGNEPDGSLPDGAEEGEVVQE